MKHFVHFWDKVANLKEAKARSKLVIGRIQKYGPNAKSVLELGCGMGHVLANFPKKYEIFGLDLDGEYTDYCRKKIRRGKFIASNMHRFRLNKKFDSIFSVHESINYLSAFSQWTSTFEHVYNHLNEGGLFIFDVYTPKALQYFKNGAESHSHFSGGMFSIKPICKDRCLTWEASITEDGKSKRVHRYKWKETIFPMNKVATELRARFEIVEMKTFEGGRRELFVCMKK